MSKNFAEMENSNTSGNATIHQQSAVARRTLLKGAALWSSQAFSGGLGVLSGLGAATAGVAHAQNAASAVKNAVQVAFGFKPVAVDNADRVVVPAGYNATPLAAWGEAVGIAGNMPAFKMDGSNSAADQDVQMGMHHDGIHFYSLDADSNASKRGLLVMNHEYVDDGLLHLGGHAGWSAEKVQKSQAAHGVSVVEVRDTGKGWEMVRPSNYARRITARTPFSVNGPARGHKMMQTTADPQGHTVLGTLNNCASGKTPWGTYLSGEENFAFYFANTDPADPHQKRWGLRKDSFFNWSAHDARFDLAQNPNEANRFGWVVEVDPMDPKSTPVKRTALGRAAHEGAWVAVTQDGRAVVYSGEDARNEYIYKFVSRDRIAPAGNGLTQAQANRELLDHGTLYVARFNADGKGQWLPLVHGQGALTAAQGFADQGEVCIKARQASDILGGTKMDRPEWLAIDPQSGWVYCTLTNNSARGSAASPVDAANPRAQNAHGHIIRWKEAGDFQNTTFEWNHLVLAGDPANARPDAKGKISGDVFGCPDGIMFDTAGRLWVQTDAHASQMYKGEFQGIGNNQMLAFDAANNRFMRFMTAPVNSEVTGATWTPDGKTLFINIQHPGETAGDRSDPANPARFSNWPDFKPGGRPRSATVVIRKDDGGVIGS